MTTVKTNIQEFQDKCWHCNHPTKTIIAQKNPPQNEKKPKTQLWTFPRENNLEWSLYQEQQKLSTIYGKLGFWLNDFKQFLPLPSPHYLEHFSAIRRIGE